MAMSIFFTEEATEASVVGEETTELSTSGSMRRGTMRGRLKDRLDKARVRHHLGCTAMIHVYVE